MQRDVLESRMYEHVGRCVRVGHREQARPARGLVCRVGSGQESLGNPLGAVQPVVVELASPHHHAEAAAGDERVPHIAEGYHWIGEEHRPETREDVVETTVELACLDIVDEEARVRDPCPRRLPSSGVDEALAGSRSAVRGSTLTLHSARRGDQYAWPDRRRGPSRLSRYRAQGQGPCADGNARPTRSTPGCWPNYRRVIWCPKPGCPARASAASARRRASGCIWCVTARR
jgi:hypothetical protein